MQPVQFTYWLQGYVELTNGQLPNLTQWQTIVDHVKEVNRTAAAQTQPSGFSPFFLDGTTSVGGSYLVC